MVSESDHRRVQPLLMLSSDADRTATVIDFIVVTCPFPHLQTHTHQTFTLMSEDGHISNHGNGVGLASAIPTHRNYRE